MTIADAWNHGLAWPEVPVYLAAQVIGAFVGVAVAHVMFGEPLFFASQRVRAGGAQLVSEFVATFGLLAVIWGCARHHAQAVPYAVAAYITAAAGSPRPRRSPTRRSPSRGRRPIPSQASGPPTCPGSWPHNVWGRARPP